MGIDRPENEILFEILSAEDVNKLQASLYFK